MSPGSSVGDGGTSGSRGRGNDGDDGGGGGGGGRRGAESMELRDFRARLMSKGLDGWGAEGEEAGRGEESGAGKGKARGLDGAATSERCVVFLWNETHGESVQNKGRPFYRQAPIPTPHQCVFSFGVNLVFLYLHVPIYTRVLFLFCSG